MKRIRPTFILQLFFLFSPLFYKHKRLLLKTLRLRFICPSVFLKRSLSVFYLLPQCFLFAPSMFFHTIIFILLHLHTTTLLPY